MPNFFRTEIASVFNVKSVITVYYFDTNSVHPDEHHNFPEFIYADKGSYSLTLNDNTVNLEEGQLLIVEPNAHHSSTPKNTTLAIVSFELESDYMNTLYNRAITLNYSQRALLSDIITNGIEIFKQVPIGSEYKGLMPSEDIASYEFQAMKNKIELLLIDLYRSQKIIITKPGAKNFENYKALQFELLIKYMKEHLNKVLTLEQISSDMGMSVSKIKRLFKEHKNTTPIYYFTRLKVKEAKRLICDTSMNFTQIADCLGYESLHYFSKVFKKHTGLSPTEYAKSVYAK